MHRPEALGRASPVERVAVGCAAEGDTSRRGGLECGRRLASRTVDFSNDLAPDGKRLAAFVADDKNGGKPIMQLTFLLNFSDELRRRVSAGK